ncbi:PAXNEB protein-domain-containing protein [Ochromonadaceae sp. CCMP2298]|nr:PAXNEB protein-domain-containing protein [Ochromonadaceae sp. CCMP2298]
MSSFRKSEKFNQNASQSLLDVSGMKPSVNTGLGLVSSGSRELDDVLGGGLALGTVTLLEGDSFSNYSDTLLLYALAEGVSHRHATLLVTASALAARRWLQALPYNQHVGGASGSGGIGSGRGGGSSGETVAASGEKIELSIAWQYEKYLKPKDDGAGEGSGRVRFCCGFDLSRSMQSELLQQCDLRTCHGDSFAEGGEEGAEAGAEGVAQRLLSEIATFLNKHVSSSANGAASASVASASTSASPSASTSASPIGRIFLPHLEQTLMDGLSTQGELSPPSMGRVLGRFLLRLKHLVRSMRVCVVVSMQAGGVDTHSASALGTVADTVLAVRSFAGVAHTVPYEFESFQGLLQVLKLQQYGALVPFRPSGVHFGLRRDRRKLHVEPLHLPPEETRALGNAGARPSQEPDPNDAVAGVVAVAGQVQMHVHHGGGQAGVGADRRAIGTGQGAGEVAAHSHTHPHAPTQGASTASVRKQTPLAASLAALKAARETAKEAGGSTGSGASGLLPPPQSKFLPLPAPVSINASPSDPKQSW